MEFIFVIGFVIVFLWLFKIQNQLDQLSSGEQISQKIPTIANTHKPEPVNEVFADLGTKSKTVTKSAKNIIQKEVTPTNWEQLITKRIFPIIGSVSLLIGITYFVVLAINNDCIGPSVQIALGVVASLGLILLGEKLKLKYPDYYHYLTATGIAGLILITYVARSVYDMVSVSESLVLYSLQVGLGVWLSLRYNSRILGNLSILGGLVAPLLTKTEDPNALGLMMFLAVLSGGGFVLSTYKAWFEILLILLLGVIGFEFMLLNNTGFESQPILFLILIYGIHYVLGSGGFVRALRGTEKKQKTTVLQSEADLTVIIGSVLIANVLGYQIFESQGWDYFGGLVLLQGLIFAAMAYVSYLKNLPSYQIIGLIGALTALAFATLFELKAVPALLITLVIVLESLVATYFGDRFKNKILSGFGLFMALVSVIYLTDITTIWWHFVGMSFVIGALFLSAFGAQKELHGKLVSALVVIISTWLVLHWNFEYLTDIIADYTYKDVLGLMVPAFWAACLANFSEVRKEIVYLWAGVATAGIVSVLSLWMYDLKVLNSVLILGLLGIMFGFMIAPIRAHKLSLEHQQTLYWIILGLGLINLLGFGLETLNEPIRTLFWLACGGVLLTSGLYKSWSQVRFAGLGLIALIIAKLYIYDIWDLEIWMRFVAFFALGVSLLLIAFYYQRFSKYD